MTREQTMDRRASRIVGGRVVQFAGGGAGPLALSDDELRERAAYCPPHIRRAIDAVRESRGQRRLWACAGEPTTRAPAKPGGAPSGRRHQRLDTVTLVGFAAPGVSAVRVRAASDGERLRERIVPTAFHRLLRAVSSGVTTVRFTDGHGGDVLADTASRTLRLEVHPEAGLLVMADIPVLSLHRQLLADAMSGEAALSLGLRPVRIQLRQERGERLRVVQETAVDHVAVIRRLIGQGMPCYRTKIFGAFTADDQAVAAARAKALKHALAQLRQQRRR